MRQGLVGEAEAHNPRFRSTRDRLSRPAAVIVLYSSVQFKLDVMLILTPK